MRRLVERPGDIDGSADPVIVGGEDGESGACCGSVEVLNQIDHGGLGGVAVELQDALAHLGTSIISVRVFASTGCLPRLREIVPAVVGVEDADDVRHPAVDQIGSAHHGVKVVDAAEIVSHDTDRVVDFSSSLISQ